MMPDNLYTISINSVKHLRGTYIMIRLRKIGLIFLGILIFLLMFFGLQRLFEPKYTGKVIEGNFTGEYYEDQSFHDVLFIGDCEVYENISPIVLWREFGITSFIRGSADQMPAQSYYLLEDALRYETPKVVVWNVGGMKQGEQEKETYNRMTMDGMRWSSSKWNAIKATMLPEEHMIEYIFPLLRYHSRWSDLSSDDFTYYFHRPEVSYNGYYMRCDVREAEEFPAERRQASYEFPDSSWEYLDKMEELCRKNGIQLVLIKAPALYPTWPDQYEEQIKNYAKEKNLVYINYMDADLDYQTDTYDGGLHLNIYGAEKFSDYLGKDLKEETALADHRGEEALSSIWDEKAARYDSDRLLQEEEIKEFGYLKQFSDEQ